MKLLKKTSYLIFLFFTFCLQANVADFEFKATFKRNPKIWGTYKLEKEQIKIQRGKLSWKKRPDKRIGDIVISNGHLVFVRENKENGETRIIVDKIPYKRDKNTFTAENIDPEIMSRLFENDLKDNIPHRDLLQGNIDYNKIVCTKEKSKLSCTLKGKVSPR